MKYDLCYLIIEIILDLVSLLLGAVLIIKAQDNRLRKIWGILVVFLALVMLQCNFFWLYKLRIGLVEDKFYLLSVSRMLKWYLAAFIFSLFPIASLRPGWLTTLRLVIFILPVSVIMVIAFCYQWFNGYFTTLTGIGDVVANIDKLDVRLRLGIFAVSMASPLINFIIPFWARWTGPVRRMNKRMYVYCACCIVTFLLYILLTLFPSGLIFNIYGYVIEVLPIVFTIMYLKNENPFSYPAEAMSMKPDEEEDKASPAVSPAVYKLYEIMTEYMVAEKPFTSAEYTIQELANQLSAKQSLVIKAIQYGGFTGFREYINYLRLEYFKQLATCSPGTSIKTLMFHSGFNSRSSFYRHFAEKEKMSPKEFIEKLPVGKV
jgi:hypothetical protein